MDTPGPAGTLSPAAANPQDAPMADGWEPGKFRLGNRRWLDGLRGVAILMVLGFHLRLLGGGSLGVDVFFVLSGFLITALLAEEWQRRGTISLSVVRTVGFALLL